MRKRPDVHCCTFHVCSRASGKAWRRKEREREVKIIAPFCSQLPYPPSWRSIKLSKFFDIVAVELRQQTMLEIFLPASDLHGDPVSAHPI